MRINKAVAQGLGIGRRKADQLIADCRVAVNGTNVLDFSQQVHSEDRITLDGKVLQWLPNKALYFLYHKPRGVECSFDGAQDGKDLSFWLHKDRALRYGGRLDKHSEGLMLISTDGRWLEQLSHPSHGWEKVYHVKTSPIEIDPKSARRGYIYDDGDKLSLGEWDLLETTDSGKQRWKVTLHEGQKRQIRRLVQRFGGTVYRLRRVQIGPFVLGELTPGEHAALSPQKAWERVKESQNQP